jgi:WD40 repeat protein
MNFRTVLMGATALVFSVPCSAQVVDEAGVRTIRGSKAEVTCVAVAPKGDRVLVGTDAGAELFDLDKGKKLFGFPFNEDEQSEVYHCAFNDNGEYLLLIGRTGKRQVWDTKTGKQEKVLASHRWIPTPGEVKAMGLVADNSIVDRFYQQTMASHNDITARAASAGSVEFVDDEGTVLQTLSFPENKDRHHLAPCLFAEDLFFTGTDDGRVMIYPLR